ncbi:MAG: MFS transporter [Dehalococcoidia bacterium]
MADAAVLAAPVAAEPIVTRNPFANANYRRWWAASVVAGLGVGIQLVTVPLFVRDRVDPDYRAIALAGALICQTLPAAFLVLIGGVVADRVERRSILVRTYGAAALVSTAYVFLVASDVRSIWPVFPLAAIVGAANAFTQPARQAMMPAMLAPSQLQNGIILGTVAFMAAFQFGGPGLAGITADGVGLEFAFGLEVVFLAVGAFLYSRISTDIPPRTGRSIRVDLAEGMSYARRNVAILGLLLISALPGIFFIAPFNVTLVLIVEDVLHEADRYVGLLTASFGLGVVLGSLAMTLGRLPRRGWLLLGSSITGGLILVAYGLSESLPVTMAVLFVWGLSAAIFINLAVALLQENTEGSVMGRVMSMYSLAFMASLPIGYLQAGILASLLGPQEALVISGIIVASVGVSFLLFLGPVRRLA